LSFTLAGTSYGLGPMVRAHPSPGDGVGPTPASYYGLDARSGAQAWFVGEKGDPLNHGARALTEHWQSGSWVGVPAENPGGDRSTILYDVSADSPSDGWAVGSYEPDFGYWATLAEHWDGASWHTVPTPRPGNLNQAGILSVSAVSPKVAFAVMGDTESHSSSLVRGARHHKPQPGWIIRWDGTAWHDKYLPASKGEYVMLGISMDSATDGWAVGYNYLRREFRAVTAHWDGTGWTDVPNPATGYRVRLQGVDAVSPTDVWAVGGSDFQGTIQALHWDGSEWTDLQPPPIVGELHSVFEVAPGNVWAVGVGEKGSIALHWIGSTWKETKFPISSTQLWDVSGDRPHDVWTVGNLGEGSSRPTAVLGHWDGKKWTTP